MPQQMIWFFVSIAFVWEMMTKVPDQLSATRK